MENVADVGSWVGRASGGDAVLRAAAAGGRRCRGRAPAHREHWPSTSTHCAPTTRRNILSVKVNVDGLLYVICEVELKRFLIDKHCANDILLNSNYDCAVYDVFC